MVVSSHQANRLLEPSLRPEETLEVVAVATGARSVLLMLLLLFGLPAVVLAVLMVAGVDARVPWVTVAAAAGCVGAMVLAVAIVKNTGRRYVVGLTQSRLLVARFVDRSWLRIGSVWGYDRETLQASGARTRYANVESTNVRMVRGRLKLVDPRIPHELEFVDAVMPNNLQAFRVLHLAITPSTDAEQTAA